MEIQTVAAATARVGVASGVVVLGMGRSGTSAVTRSLVHSGFFAGRDSELMQPTQANPFGFYENLSVFRIDEEILERIGGTWFTPPTSQAQLAVASWAVPTVRSVVARLVDQAAGAPVAVKDPRIGVLLELWGPVIAEALHPVLVVRNPIEIARSLATRDGTPVPFALASWELHTGRVLEFLRGRRVTVVRYERLASSPRAAAELVSDVAAQLRPELGVAVDRAAAGRAIEPALHREHADAVDAAAYLTGEQLELWRFLDGLAPGAQVLDAPVDLSPQTGAAEVLSRCEVDRVRAERELGELRARVAGYGSALAEAERGRVEAERGRVEAERGRRDERERARAAEHWLNDIQASASWRLTAPLRTALRGVRHAVAVVRRSR